MGAENRWKRFLSGVTFLKPESYVKESRGNKNQLGGIYSRIGETHVCIAWMDGCDYNGNENVDDYIGQHLHSQCAGKLESTVLHVPLPSFSS